MVVQIDTIYEDGVFKPQEKIAWEIFQKLKQSLTVSRTAYRGQGFKRVQVPFSSCQT